MKYLIARLILLLGILISADLIAAQEEETPPEVPLTTTTILNFRASPMDDAYVMRGIPAETQLIATAQVGDWVQVAYNNQVGWISANFVVWGGDPSGLINPFISTDDNISYDAFVTTQDKTSFRVGPGIDFERIAVIEPGVTLPAVGRTADRTWIQIVYNGEYGWVRDWLLVWTGDVITLELDGIDPVPFVRRTLAQAWIFPERDIYSQANQREPDVFGLISHPTRVELTGRFGSAGGGRLQFYYEGEYYWIVNDGRITNAILSLPDLAANAPYGRLLGKIRTAVNITTEPNQQITNLWQSLASGREVTCEAIPRPVRAIQFTAADLQAEPTFTVAARAVESAIENTNLAIESLEVLCGGSGIDRLASPEMIQTAITQLETAQRNLYLVQTFFSPLAQRDPILGN